MQASYAKQILDGIIESACRQLGKDAKKFRVKPGGKMMDQSLIDWYTNVQNVEGLSRNTSQAKVKSLIKFQFGIVRKAESEPVKLIVKEWNAAKDWNADYRVIFEKPSDDMRGRVEMVELLKIAINQCSK